MALNRFILNRDYGLSSTVRKTVESIYPDIAKVDRMSVNHPVSSSGGEVVLYEGSGSGRTERIVWGATRMGSKRVVAS